MKRTLTTGTMILVGFLFAVLSSRRAEAGTSCHLINARAVGKDISATQEQDGTLHIETSAAVIGAGLLHGAIAGNLTVPPFEGPVAEFTETATFATAHGTITISLHGWIDFRSAHFNASGPVTAATEKLKGSTGTLSVSCVGDNGSFTEDFSGAFCVDLAP